VNRRPFRVGIMCGEPADIARTFLERNAPRLRPSGVEVAVLVIDQEGDRAQAPFRHLWRLGRRQARIAGTNTVMGVLKLLVYRTVMAWGRSGSLRSPEPAPIPPDVRVVRSRTLNAAAAVTAVQEAKCNLVCLMGARILTRKTLQALAVPIVNIHSSDPRWVRGGPVVVWEVLDGRPAITLAVHEVVEALDAGKIFAQGSQRLLYLGGLGATTEATMAAARPHVGDLFETVIRAFQAGSAVGIPFAPGELRVTPRIRETLRAELLCRARSRGRRQRPAREQPSASA
jgi:hypothetical protein